MIGYSKSDQVGTTKKKKSQGTINREANKSLDQIYKAKNKHHICELRLSKNCLKQEIESFGVKLKMTYAHKQKRNWYKTGNRMGLLKSYNHTIRACIPCHMEIEHDKDLTRKLFLKLRPVMKLKTG